VTRAERLSKRWDRLLALEKAGLAASAVLAAQVLLEDDPEFEFAWSVLGRILTSLNRYEEAEDAIARAISLCPEGKTYIPFAEMGHLFDSRGDLPRAEEWYRKAVEARPESANGYNYLGSVLARQGRLEEAEMVHRTSLGCAEGCIDEAYLNLGLILRAQERFVEASECFVQAITLDPNYRDAKKALRDVGQAIKIQRPS
jgi:tetratricopeptide (TPR) repeat protein